MPAISRAFSSKDSTAEPWRRSVRLGQSTREQAVHDHLLPEPTMET
jgi:hypothetical protein